MTTMAAAPYRVPRIVKNDLYKAAEELRLVQSEFTWADIDDEPRVSGERLIHRPTGYEFHFVMYEPSRQLSISWQPPLPDGGTILHGVDQNDQLHHAIMWLHMVKRDHEAPDLWGAAVQEAELIAGDVTDGDRRFTPTEVHVISERIDRLEEQLLALAPAASVEDRAQVHESFVEATQAATVLSRKDWKALLIGKLLDVMIKLAFDPAKVQQAFHWTATLIGPLVSNIRGFLSP